MELTYKKVGDYYIPDLILDDQPDKPLGRYGRMRQKFLEEHYPGTYNRLMLSGKLWTHLWPTLTQPARNGWTRSSPLWQSGRG